MIDFDGAWKYVIERMFRWMIELLSPELAAEIDWSVAPEFMDQELPSLAGKRKRGGRIVDKLVKVRLLRGGDRYLLIHVEAQNKRDKDFPNRVFTIFYRLRDKFQFDADITCLTLLTDLNPTWKPDCFEHSGFGVRLRFEYPCVKLMALEPLLVAMEEENPFAMVANIHLDLMRRRAQADPVAWKLKHFLQALRMRGRFSARDAATILAFIDWLMRLPAELDNQLKKRINKRMKEAGMEWTGGIHGNIRILALQEGLIKGRDEGRNEGLNEGLNKGLHQGRNEGRNEGRVEGRREMLTHLLKIKFGEVPEVLVDRIETAPSEMITDWFDRALVAKDPSELLPS